MFQSAPLPILQGLPAATGEDMIMTNHAIKIKRALRLSKIGACSGSALAMLDAIPASAVAGLPAKALAELLDAMWRACQEAKALAESGAVAEGAIWDARSQRLREIAR